MVVPSPGRTRRRGAALAVALTIAASTVAMAAPASAADPRTRLDLSLFTQAAGAAAQPTAEGRRISDLLIDDGRVFAGYGDYGANTGPIDLYSYDLASGAATRHISIPTEDVDVITRIGEHLYVPSIDPRDDWDAPVGFATDRSGSWAMAAAAPMIHVYDVASTDGTDLFLAGSSHDAATGAAYAAIWYSPDGVSDWQLIQRRGTGAGDYARYYWMEAVDGRLYTSAVLDDVLGPLERWEDGTWTTVREDSSAFWTYEADQVQSIGSDLVSYGWGSAVRVYDTIADRFVAPTYDIVPGAAGLRDIYRAESGALYTLNGNGEIYRSADGRAWARFATIDPTTAYSIAVDEATGSVYVGSDAAILRAETRAGTPTPTPTATPAPSPTPTPTATPAPSPTPTPTPTATPAPSPTPTPTTAPPAGDTGYTAVYRAGAAWAGAYTAELTVSAATSGAPLPWRVSWSDPDATGILSAWGTTCDVDGGVVTCTADGYGADAFRWGTTASVGVQVATRGTAPHAPALALGAQSPPTSTPVPSDERDYAAAWRVAATWPGAYTAELTVTTARAGAPLPWTLSWSDPTALAATSSWGATCDVEAGVVTCVADGYGRDNFQWATSVTVGVQVHTIGTAPASPRLALG